MPFPAWPTSQGCEWQFALCSFLHSPVDFLIALLPKKQKTCSKPPTASKPGLRLVFLCTIAAGSASSNRNVGPPATAGFGQYLGISARPFQGVCADLRLLAGVKPPCRGKIYTTALIRGRVRRLWPRRAWSETEVVSLYASNRHKCSLPVMLCCPSR